MSNITGKRIALIVGSLSSIVTCLFYVMALYLLKQVGLSFWWSVVVLVGGTIVVVLATIAFVMRITAQDSY